MDLEEFSVHGKEVVDYISKYVRSLDTRPVMPNVKPGYLRTLLPPEPPNGPEPWPAILQDFDTHVLPGIAHWQSPHFHAYFPAGASFPSLLGGLLSDAVGAIGFSWLSNPAGTELEIIVMNWLGKMIGLPDEFLMLNETSKGGGVIQGSASECVLVALLAARHEALAKLRALYPNTSDGQLLEKLVMYCSDQAHSCVEKAAMIGFVKIRILEVDHRYRLRGKTLADAIQEDKQEGLHPFFCVATLGTTGSCAFDVLSEVGPVCREEDLWLHVDAAYAGCAFICPELRTFLNGIEYANSFNTNCNKFLLVNFDCSAMWLKERHKLIQSMAVSPVYLQHQNSDRAIDYRHWHIPLSRRFRALKLWCVIRSYGVEGLQAYIRRHIKLAKYFEALVWKDRRFQICNDVHLGLVCFQFKHSNDLTKRLLDAVNATKKIFMIPATLRDRFIIRFCICAEQSKRQHVAYAWNIIRSTAEILLAENNISKLVIAEENGMEDETVEDEVFSGTPEAAATGRPSLSRLMSDPGYLSVQLLSPVSRNFARHLSVTAYG